MEPLFTGPLGPTALARLTQLHQARQRLDADIGEVLATVAEAQGHTVTPGEVRLQCDLSTKRYAGFATQQPPPTLVASPADEERSA